MIRKPSRISETEFTERGLRLPLIHKTRPERWPWIALLFAPDVGVVIAAVWVFVLK